MAIDGRTELGRRVRDLAESFAQQLGGWPALTDMQAAAVRRAAELGALAEQSRRDALRGGRVDPLALSRLEGVAARAQRALGLPSAAGKPAAPTAPDLRSYLAGLKSEAAPTTASPALATPPEREPKPAEPAGTTDELPDPRFDGGREPELLDDDDE